MSIIEKALILTRNTSEILSRQKRWLRRFTIALWVFTLSFVILLPLYIYSVIANPYDLFGAMPSLLDIENPKNDLSSEVIASDGVSLGRYFRFNRSMVTYDELSADLVQTLLASEDHRFYEHSGIDLHAFGRVFLGIITFNLQGGGSTLSQQTAKNLFRTREEELQGKISRLGSVFEVVISKTKEWIIAVQLEKNFTKEEIIALYLNTVPFSNQAFGIKVASETYFQKHPSQLNLQESALLVGLLQGNSLFNPIRHPERAQRKRNEVLQKVFVSGYIHTLAAADSLKGLPLQVNFSPQDHNEGLAPYFRNVLKNELLRWCKEKDIDLLNSGLKIYTTIDSRLQRAAERAMREHMANLQKAFEAGWKGRNPWVDDSGVEIKDFLKRKIRRTDVYRELVTEFGEDSDAIEEKLLEKKKMKIFTWNGTRDTTFNAYDSVQYYNKFLQSGLMSMEPETGAVKAWVGGINHAYFKFDHVKQSLRQAGSTFKPFVYGLAVENGYSVCQQFHDTSPEIAVNGKIYHPKNANGTFGDGTLYTMRQGLAKSLNSITVQLMHLLKPDNVASFARKCGITSGIDPVYSLALGTSDVSLYEITGAYSAFVNHGVYTKPYYITRIEDRHGNVIENFLPVKKEVMDEGTAYQIVYLLQGGVQEPGGTSRALSEAVKADNDVGGKTGTTDNGSDGWYVGITHNLVTGVWVGGDERSIHFPRWGESSGGKTALPIWDKFMTQVYAHPEYGYGKGKFKKPLVFNVNFDCNRYNEPDSTFQQGDLIN
jgi:penicillin-binding protein 1A